MKRLLILILLFFTLPTLSKAQADTTYFYSNGSKVSNKNTKSADYYELNSGKERKGKIERFYVNHKPYGYANYSENKQHGNYVILYSSGNIKESGLYENGKAVGMRKRRYQNGTMRSTELMKGYVHYHQPRLVNAWDSLGNLVVSNGEGTYRNALFHNDKLVEEGTLTKGFRTGLWITSNSERVLYKDTYNDEGKLISGVSYDDKGKSYKYTEFEEDATFKGGMAAWNSFLARNLKYPLEAKRYGEEGNVYLTFIIDENGDIKDEEISRGVSRSCNEEALRVLKRSKKWIPGKQRGQPVTQRMNLRVVFRLK